MNIRTSIALALLATGSASADVITWSAPLFGFQDWSDPANWSPAAVPGPFDDVVFDGALGRATIAIDDPAIWIANLEIALGGNEITVRNPGGLTVSGGTPFQPSVAVGTIGPAYLELDVGATAGRFEASFVDVGVDAPGHLEFRTSPGDLSDPAVMLDTVRVGAGAPGRLTSRFVIRPVSIDRLLVGTGHDGFIGDSPSVFGGLEVTEQLDVGHTSYGSTTGMTIRTQDLNVATLGGSTGVVDDTWLEVAGNADIGLRGLAFVESASVTVDGDLAIGVLAESADPPVTSFGQGFVTIPDEGLLDVGGDLILGFLGGCDLELSTTSRTNVGGSIDTNAFDPTGALRTLAFRLEAPTLANGVEAVAYAELDAFLPRVELRLGPDHAPSAGDAWILVEAGGVIEYDSITLPLLADPLNWNVRVEDGRLIAEVTGPGAAPDVDGDGTVGLSDLLAVLAAWGPCGDCPADVDGDGSVTLSDLLAVLAAWD